MGPKNKRRGHERFIVGSSFINCILFHLCWFVIWNVVMIVDDIWADETSHLADPVIIVFIHVMQNQYVI